MRSRRVAVEVADFVRDVPDHAHLEALFSQSELADSELTIGPAGTGTRSNESLAARYAAKLAVLDLLGLEATPDNLRDLTLSETGAAPRVSGCPGGTTPEGILISIAHDSGLAVALAAMD